MPLPIYKSNGYIGVARQTVFGTPVAPLTGHFIKYLSESLVNEQDEIKGAEGGFGRYLIETYKTVHRASGEIAAFVRPDVFAFFAALTLGKDVLTPKAAGATPSVHTITPLIPGFMTIERGIDPATPLIVERFQDMHPNSLTIEGEQSNPMKFSAALLGTKGHVEAGATAVTYETNDPIMFFSNPTFKVDGGATVEISKFSIKISNNLDLWYGPSMTPSEIIEKALTIEVAFTLKFLDVTQYKKVYYGASTAIVGTIASGSFQVQAGNGAALDALRSIDINIKNIKYKTAPVNLAPDAGPIMQECVGYAYKPGADNLIDIVVKNSYDTAYL